MITIEQIKAARGLLDWSQGDLAKAADLSLVAINNMERKKTEPRSSTIAHIKKTFEIAGVEFTEGPGVRMRGEPFEFLKFEGKDFIDCQVEDIIRHTKRRGELWICNSDEQKIRQYGASSDDNYQKFVRALEIDERIIVPQGHDYFISRPETYRWLPAEAIGHACWVVYADRISFLIWEKPMRCIIIRSQSLADAYKRQFQFLWKQAKIPDSAAKKP